MFQPATFAEVASMFATMFAAFAALHWYLKKYSRDMQAAVNRREEIVEIIPDGDPAALQHGRWVLRILCLDRDMSGSELVDLTGFRRLDKKVAEDFLLSHQGFSDRELSRVRYFCHGKTEANGILVPLMARHDITRQGWSNGLLSGILDQGERIISKTYLSPSPAWDYHREGSLFLYAEWE